MFCWDGRGSCAKQVLQKGVFRRERNISKTSKLKLMIVINRGSGILWGEISGVELSIFGRKKNFSFSHGEGGKFCLPSSPSKLNS
jgi:hypothetical protein